MRARWQRLKDRCRRFLASIAKGLDDVDWDWD